MIDEAAVEKLVGAFDRLNANLETIHEDNRRLTANVKELSARMRTVEPLTRQLAMLNQIMLQTSKMAGASGMIEHLLNSLLTFARKAR